MSTAKPLAGLLFLLGTLAAGFATAQESGEASAARTGKPEARPQAQEERAADAGQPKGRADQPAATAAPHGKKPPRRRAVRQVIATMPPPPGPSYGPSLYPAGPPPSVPSVPAVPAPPAAQRTVVPPPPAPINSCAGNFCTDASGNTYNAGTGNAAVDSQGRLCNRVGNTMQCF